MFDGLLIVCHSQVPLDGGGYPASVRACFQGVSTHQYLYRCCAVRRHGHRVRTPTHLRSASCCCLAALTVGPRRLCRFSLLASSSSSKARPLSTSTSAGIATLGKAWAFLALPVVVSLRFRAGAWLLREADPRQALATIHADPIAASLAWDYAFVAAACALLVFVDASPREGQPGASQRWSLLALTMLAPPLGMSAYIAQRELDGRTGSLRAVGKVRCTWQRQSRSRYVSLTIVVPAYLPACLPAWLSRSRAAVRWWTSCSTSWLCPR